MAIIEQCVRNRVPLPSKIQNAPEILAGLDFYYTAFMDMTSCRELGYGQVGPVSWLTIQRYCEVYGIEGESREDMFYHVHKLDRTYLDWIETKRGKD